MEKLNNHLINISNISKNHLSSFSVKEFMNSMYTFYLNKMLKEINKFEFISISIDES